MIELLITNVREYNTYDMLDKDKNKYSLIFEFYEMENLKLGDTIFLDKEMLNVNSENFVQPYAFEPTNDLNYDAKAIVNKKEVLLRRIYG